MRYGVPSNSARTIRVTRDKVGSFRRGNRNSDGLLGRTTLEHDDSIFDKGHYVPETGRFGTGFLNDPIPVVTASQPYADTPFEARKRAPRKVYVCPGCGIVPPRSGKCDQCW
jgi:hypothetical protein